MPNNSFNEDLFFTRRSRYKCAGYAGRYASKSMKVITALVILVSLVQVGSALAAPLVVRCSAEKPWLIKSRTVEIQIDIVLPERLNQFVWVADQDLENLNLPSDRSVGLGTIEITEWVYDAAETLPKSLVKKGRGHSRRHKFIVTDMPSEKISLIGFYLDGPFIYSIRADLWKKEKPFTSWSMRRNEVFKGRCD